MSKYWAESWQARVTVEFQHTAQLSGLGLRGDLHVIWEMTGCPRNLTQFPGVRAIRPGQ